jgi:hypothetical protein
MAVKISKPRPENGGYAIASTIAVSSLSVGNACSDESDPRQRQLELSRNPPDSSADLIAADVAPPACLA